MVTLQETTVKFNNNLYVSHTGGRLASDSGLALVDEFMNAFHFTEHSKDFVQFKEDRRYWKDDNHKILKQLLFQLISGCKADISANILQHDPVLQTFSTDGIWVSSPLSLDFTIDLVNKQLKIYKHLTKYLLIQHDLFVMIRI